MRMRHPQQYKGDPSRLSKSLQAQTRMDAEVQRATPLSGLTTPTSLGSPSPGTTTAPESVEPNATV